MKKNIRILIADDHFFVRKGLQQVLSERFPDVEFGEAEDGQKALQAVWGAEWDVMLLDISMPGRGGLDTLKEVKQTKPKLPVIILSMHPEDQFAIRVLKLGACAYIRKDSAGGELVKGVECALKGSRYITPSLAEKLAAHLQENRNGAPHEELSDREYQVMCLLASGKTVKEAGAHLALSVKTISTYRTRILEKTGLKNNSQIMRYAVNNGLIDIEAAG
jgi:two-component system, NarL family, invasion response regulator UvrY